MSESKERQAVCGGALGLARCRDESPGAEGEVPGEGLSEEQRRRRLREGVDNVGIRRERHGERLLL